MNCPALNTWRRAPKSLLICLILLSLCLGLFARALVRVERERQALAVGLCMLDPAGRNSLIPARTVSLRVRAGPSTCSTCSFPEALAPGTEPRAWWTIAPSLFVLFLPSLFRPNRGLGAG